VPSQSKQDLVIQMLRRQSGVTIEDIMAKTGWQPHSVRGFFSGLVKEARFRLFPAARTACAAITSRDRVLSKQWRGAGLARAAKERGRALTLLHTQTPGFSRACGW
jgi:hypothetical protein